MMQNKIPPTQLVRTQNSLCNPYPVYSDEVNIFRPPSTSSMRKKPASGAGLCLCGFFFWKVLGIPLVKHVFSISITCFTQGLCLLLLAATYVVTDIWKFRRGTGLVLLWGQCALFAYFMSHVFPGSYWSVSEKCLQGLPRLVSDARLVTVLNAVGAMVVLTFFMVVWRQFRAARKG